MTTLVRSRWARSCPAAATPTRSPPRQPPPSPIATDRPRPTPAAPDGSANARPAIASPPARDPALPVVSADRRSASPEPAGLSATPATRRALQTRLDQLRERYASRASRSRSLFPDGSDLVGRERPGRRRGQGAGHPRRPSSPSPASARPSRRRSCWPSPRTARSTSTRRCGRYLPDAQKVNAKITVRQLLDHTSGLRDYFFHPVDRPAAADATRPPLGRRRRDEVRRQGRTSSRARAGTTRTRTTSCSGCSPSGSARRRSADQVRDPLPRAARPRPHLVPAGGGAARTVAHGYRFESTVEGRARHRPVRRHAGRAVHLGRDRRRRRRRLRLQRDATSRAGRAPSTAARCSRRSTVDAMVGDVSRDRAVQAARAVRPRRPAPSTSTGSRRSATPAGCSAFAR